MANLQQAEEAWKSIPGYEGYYEVSTLGNVRSISRKVKNGKGGYYYTKPRILAPRRATGGYLMVMLWKANESRVFQIHRLVAQAFLPNPLNLPQVNHKEGDKTDNRSTMLEWCSQEYNMQHAYVTGLSQKPPIHYGADNPKAKRIRDTNTGKVYDTIIDATVDLKISRYTVWRILSDRHSLNNLQYCPPE